MIEHEGHCDDAADCPLCHGEMAPEFVEWVEWAAAQPRRVMNIDDFKTWLDGLSTGSTID